MSLKKSRIIEKNGNKYVKEGNTYYLVLPPVYDGKDENFLYFCDGNDQHSFFVRQDLSLIKKKIKVPTKLINEAYIVVVEETRQGVSKLHPTGNYFVFCEDGKCKLEDKEIIEVITPRVAITENCDENGIYFTLKDLKSGAIIDRTSSYLEGERIELNNGFIGVGNPLTSNYRSYSLRTIELIIQNHDKKMSLKKKKS